MKQIESRGVSLGYEGKTIVHDINFEVNEGDYLCIVGENGSGKSTLIKALLKKISPLEGELIVDREGIGYLPQQTDIQKDFPASVWEVIRSGCIGEGLFPSKEALNDAKENMKKLGIDNLSKKSFRDISGGQRQRALLCRSLCAAKKLLILDEPVTGLDPIATSEMYEQIYLLNKEGLTVVMVSHDIPAAVKYASHILHIAEKPLFFGRAEDYAKSGAGLFYTAKEAEK